MQLGKIQQVENVVDIEIDEQAVARDAKVVTVTPVDVRENESVNA